MNTLAALKREAINFKWSLVATNSRWFSNGIPEFLSIYRKVLKVQSDRIAFETIKNGVISESWAILPKAKQVDIVKDNSIDDAYFVTFVDDANTFLKYHLIKN